VISYELSLGLDLHLSQGVGFYQACLMFARSCKRGITYMQAVLTVEGSMSTLSFYLKFFADFIARRCVWLTVSYIVKIAFSCISSSSCPYCWSVYNWCVVIRWSVQVDSVGGHCVCGQAVGQCRQHCLVSASSSRAAVKPSRHAVRRLPQSGNSLLLTF